MLTVSQLSQNFNISRSTILYYERSGLFLPASRSSSGYRLYGSKECERLKSIIAYRSFGIPVVNIIELVENQDSMTQEQVLKNQFHSLEKEVQNLRLQQKAIVTLLEQPELLDQEILTKERWKAVMMKAGLNEQDMINWHKQFEMMEPDAHQEFLESLHIDADEIAVMRQQFQS